MAEQYYKEQRIGKNKEQLSIALLSTNHILGATAFLDYFLKDFPKYKFNKLDIQTVEKKIKIHGSSKNITKFIKIREKFVPALKLVAPSAVNTSVLDA